MKTTERNRFTALMLALMIMLSAGTLHAQSKPTLGVIGLEVNGVSITPVLLSNLLRMEIERTDKYAVIDKHDINAVLAQEGLAAESCIGKNCLVKAGRALKADKMISGSVNKFGNKIVVSLRLIDVQKDAVDKSQIDDYRDLQENIQDMIRISVQKLLGLAYNQDLARTLTKPEDYESAINNPGASRLILSGPRVGLAFVTGLSGERLMAPREDGGWNGYPFMTIFGYQHEIQYLNEGNFQALFEFMPMVAGLDQNLFNPSISILNGFRMNLEGLEFALGPNFSLTPIARGYYSEGRWISIGDNAAPAGVKVEERLDRNGALQFSSAFVFAIGKSFRSGRLNVPVNFYVIPSRQGWRAGICFGFNAKKRELE